MNSVTPPTLPTSLRDSALRFGVRDALAQPLACCPFRLFKLGLHPTLNLQGYFRELLLGDRRPLGMQPG